MTREVSRQAALDQAAAGALDRLSHARNQGEGLCLDSFEVIALAAWIADRLDPRPGAKGL